MRFRIQSTLPVILVVVICVAAAGVVLPGCSPAPDQPAAEPEEPVAEAAEPEEPAARPEEVAAEPEEPVAEAAEAAAAEPEQPSAESQASATAPEEPAEEPQGPATGPQEPAAESQEPDEPAEPAAEPSAEAKVSEYAPAEDLVGQVDYYLERLEGAVESEEDYKDSQGKIAKESNTLIVIALALGLHDEDSKHRASAGALMKAAAELAAAEDLLAAKAAVEAVKAAAVGQGPQATELRWEKVASLHELMEQVPLINNRLKRSVKKRFESKAKDIAGQSAVIAVIAQGSMANAEETEKPAEVEKWIEYCLQMRQAAAAVGAAAHAGNQEAAAAAMEKLAQSCDDCHAVFHEEEEEH